jgi:hypothetical protein
VHHAVPRRICETEDEAVARKRNQSKLASTMEDARQAVIPAAETAIDKIGTATEQAIAAVQTNVLPALADAKERLAPVVEDAKAAIVPVATEALAASKRKSHDASVKLGVVEEPKKKHRLRKLLIVLGIAGAAAFVYRKVTGGSEPTWVPTGAGSDSPTSASTSEADKSETAPTAPLASEETVESPVPTTPDAPLEEHQV